MFFVKGYLNGKYVYYIVDVLTHEKAMARVKVEDSDVKILSILYAPVLAATKELQEWPRKTTSDNAHDTRSKK